jgi:hypothetical protein
MNAKREQIVDQLGAINWETVMVIFWEDSLDEILHKLNVLFPNEDNQEFAEMIYEEIK